MTQIHPQPAAPAIPFGYRVKPVPAITTCAQAYDHLTPIFTSLPPEAQATFRTISLRYANWAQVVSVAQAFVDAIHAQFTLIETDPQATFMTPPTPPVPTALPLETAPAAPVAPVAVAPTPAAPVAPVAAVPTPAPVAAPAVPTPAPVAVTPAPAPIAVAPEPVAVTPEPTPEPVTPEPEPEAQRTPVPVPTAQNPDGLFSQLHALCGNDEQVVMYVTRKGDALTVNLIPTGTKNEPVGGLVPVTITAHPDELDQYLAGSLSEYVTLRHTQRQASLSVAAQVNKAVTGKQKTADKNRKPEAAKPSGPMGTVTLGSDVPTKAVIKGANGRETHDVGPDHRAVTLKPGAYTVTLTAEGYTDEVRSFRVTENETLNLQFVMQPMLAF